MKKFILYKEKGLSFESQLSVKNLECKTESNLARGKNICLLKKLCRKGRAFLLEKTCTKISPVLIHITKTGEIMFKEGKIVLKKRRHLILIAFGLFLVFLSYCLAGCALVDRLQAWKQGSKDILEIQDVPEGEPVPEDVITGETREVVLYFSDSAGQYLSHETRVLPKVEGIARAVMQELIAGPSVESGLLPTIPVGTRLSDINVRPDGLCIVDFTGELLDNHPGGSMNEEITVYSIVNTLTQFPTVQEVQILVDGQKVDSIAGHLDVSTTMTRNETIIQEH